MIKIIPLIDLIIFIKKLKTNNYIYNTNKNTKFLNKKKNN